VTTLRERLANRAPIDLSKLDEASLLACIDHSLLQPQLTYAEIDAGIAAAIEYHTATICCRPGDLERVVKGLRGTLVGPTTVIGFPHGAHLTEIKEREAKAAVDQGAVELDVVMNIGAFRSGELNFVRDELASVCYAVAPTPVKVIMETAYLTPEEVEKACRIVVEARGAFVKNGTGYSPRGATPEEIGLMRRTVGNSFGVKAAGGVRTLDAMLAVLAAGACRVGATATAAIAKEWRERGQEALAAVRAGGVAAASAANTSKAAVGDE